MYYFKIFFQQIVEYGLVLSLFVLSEAYFILYIQKLSFRDPLKVPKCEIFHLFDFNDFYGIKSA